MPIVIADNPLYSVVIGSGQCLEEFDALKQVLISSAAGLTAPRSPSGISWPSPDGPSRRRSVLILLVLTTITLITLDARGGDGGVGAPVRNAARDAIAPVQDGVDDSCRRSGTGGTASRSAGTSSRRTASLRRQLAERARRGRAVERGAARERELHQIDDLDVRRPTSPASTARSSSGSPGNFESTIALNKGTDDGIAADMPVVSGDGLVGRIVQRVGQALDGAAAHRPGLGRLGARLENEQRHRGRERPRRQRPAPLDFVDAAGFKVRRRRDRHRRPRARRTRRTSRSGPSRRCASRPARSSRRSGAARRRRRARTEFVRVLEVAGARDPHASAASASLLAAPRIVIVQTSILPHLRIAGRRPDLGLVATIAVAYREGRRLGAIVRLRRRALHRPLPPDPARAGGAVVRADRVPGRDRSRARLLRSSWWVAPVLGFLGGLVGGLLFVGIGALVGQEQLFELRSLRIVVLAALYDAVVAPIMFPLVAFVLRDHAPRTTSEAGGPDMVTRMSHALFSSRPGPNAGLMDSRVRTSDRGRHRPGALRRALRAPLVPPGRGDGRLRAPRRRATRSG